MGVVMLDKSYSWVIYDQEKQNRNWVDMPHEEEIIGTPLYEHATDYITLLDNGDRVMVRKSDNFIFSNNYTNIMNDEERSVALERARLEKERIQSIQKMYRAYSPYLKR